MTITQLRETTVGLTENQYQRVLVDVEDVLRQHIPEVEPDPSLKEMALEEMLATLAKGTSRAFAEHIFSQIIDEAVMDVPWTKEVANVQSHT